MSIEAKNSALWSAVEKTDRRFTKTVAQRGGYTSICPQYQLERLQRFLVHTAKGSD